MTNFFRTLGYMLIGILLAGGGQGAFARQVLMLPAVITGGNAECVAAIDAFANTEVEFAMVVGATNLMRMPVLGRANAISQTTPASAPGPYNLMQAASASSAIDDANGAIIQSAFANR
ncbi:hypothetical protein [Comamonas odontotermitis]|uniref:hypothetical protein n=1 Tax=Comamonas odontotermitis TaxID=379895 RepID=UPI001CC60569|nr:hypothetical protein [Comamonas odontotermitis]UBB18890.1 hypothetical protein LAD35_09800 [Comamonas odontotermitis]